MAEVSPSLTSCSGCLASCSVCRDSRLGCPTSCLGCLASCLGCLTSHLVYLASRLVCRDSRLVCRDSRLGCPFSRSVCLASCLGSFVSRLLISPPNRILQRQETCSSRLLTSGVCLSRLSLSCCRRRIRFSGERNTTLKPTSACDRIAVGSVQGKNLSQNVILSGAKNLAVTNVGK
jgi:hypothetical protein